MSELIRWLQEYSLPVVALLAFGAVFLFAAKLVVERAVTARLDAYAEGLRLRLGRRSSFEEKILMDRYLSFADIVTRLIRFTTNVNRLRHGGPVPEGFIVGHDAVPLTEVFEELYIRQVLLAPRLHDALLEAANVALSIVAAAGMGTEQAPSADDGGARWSSLEDAWSQRLTRLREVADEEFGLTTIRW